MRTTYKYAAALATAMALTSPAWAQSSAPVPTPTNPSQQPPAQQVPGVPSGAMPGGATQNAVPGSGLTGVDARSLTNGQRSTKVVGRNVVNEANETVGEIDDLIITPNGSVPYAVLSVGGFLGMGTRYVAVPFNSIQSQGDRMVLRGATKDGLKTMPEFKYPS